jgi:hypothetical protein
VKRKSDGPALASPAGKVHDEREGAHWVQNLTESSVDVCRYTSRSMPCWQALVDHKVVVYWVAAISPELLPSYVAGLAPASPGHGRWWRTSTSGGVWWLAGGGWLVVFSGAGGCGWWWLAVADGASCQQLCLLLRAPPLVPCRPWPLERPGWRWLVAAGAGGGVVAGGGG